MSERRLTVAVGLALLWLSSPAYSQQAAAPVPDGVRMSPVSSVVLTRPDPQCPDLARFRTDSIEYTEWANNVAVSKWTNTTETFLECVDP